MLQFDSFLSKSVFCLCIATHYHSMLIHITLEHYCLDLIGNTTEWFRVSDTSKHFLTKNYIKQDQISNSRNDITAVTAKVSFIIL